METKVIAIIVSVVAAILMLVILFIAIGKLGGEAKKSADLVKTILGGI